MKNLLDLIKATDNLYNYLINKGVKFNKEGFPIINKDMFITETPEMIVPYCHRKDKIIKNKKKTLICTFNSDEHIYPRIINVFKDIKEYKKYMGVVMLDLTVTKDMDYEWQLFTILINQLYAAVLAVNNIKIAFNTRIGSIESIISYNSIPKNVLCVSSFLGCKKDKESDFEYISKILHLLPSEIVIYGKQDINVNNKLNTLGFNYKYFKDFHSLSKGGKKYGRCKK